jgi:hypothetical protein
MVKTNNNSKKIFDNLYKINSILSYQSDKKKVNSNLTQTTVRFNTKQLNDGTKYSSDINIKSKRRI